MFSTAGNNPFISNVVVLLGEGRKRKERRINLTVLQGKFLYHLPFPSADPLSVEKIMHNAGLDPDCAPEIIDIVEVLAEFKVIEFEG